MKKKENLNAYQDAYKENFMFYNENRWYLEVYAKLISEKIIQRNYKNILSLGLGHNVVSNSLIQLLGKNLNQYIIVEGSIDIINEFEQNNEKSNIKLFHSYFEDFCSNVKYDSIEMGFILEHVDNPALILNRYKNFIIETGSIFIAVPNAKSLHRIIGEKAGLLDNLYKLSEYDLQLGHKRYFDLNSLEELIQSVGLKIVDKKGLMIKPITGEQIKKLGWQQNIIDALFEIGFDYPEIANCIYIEAKLK
jgi:2-polyprenyl-3-methyl-5-hydroxy-6-metoxy-1,4-benzoquinol methylase